MLEWMKNFFKRNKRKFVITGAIVGGVFLAGKYLQWKVEDWQEKETLRMLERAKKQQHFESNQRICYTTFRTFLPRLRDTIISKFDTTKVVNALRDIKPGSPEEVRFALWDELKVLAFSCTISSIMSTCVLYLYLKLKVNIIGGYMYLKNEEENNFNEGSDDEKYKEYFTDVKVFFDEGLPALLDDILSLVSEKIKNIPLADKFDHYQLSCLVKGIAAAFLKTAYLEEPGTSSFSALEYLVNQTTLNDTVCSSSNPLLGIWQETADLIESKDFKMALEYCIGASTDQLLKNLEPHFEYEDPEAIVEAGALTPHYTKISLPMAKILPRMSGQTHEIFKTGRNEYLDAIFNVAITEEFAANIYESFSTHSS